MRHLDTIILVVFMVLIGFVTCQVLTELGTVQTSVYKILTK